MKKQGEKFLILITSIIILIGIAVGVYLVTRPEGEFEIRREAGSQQLKIMTYNIQYVEQVPTRMNKIADYIKNNQIDIVGFQESKGMKEFPLPDQGWTDRNGVEMIKERLAEIGWEMPYLTTVPGENKLLHRDTQILSRYPISSHERLGEVLSSEEEPKYATNAHTVIVNIDGKIVRFINIHNTLNTCHALKKVLEKSNSYSEQTRIVVGDFNLTTDKDCYNQHLGEYNYIHTCDPDRDQSCEDTVNDEKHCYYGGSCDPLYYAIDHILINQGSEWEVAHSFVGHDASMSDHFPVITVLEEKSEHKVREHLYNGSFEEGLIGWERSDDIHPDWNAHSCEQFPPCADEVLYLGIAKRDDGVDPLDPYVVSDWIDLYQSVSNKRCVLSFDAMSHEASKKIPSIGLQRYPKNNDWSGTSYDTGTISVTAGSWKNFSKTITFSDTSDTQKIRVVLRVPDDDHPVYFDGITLDCSYAPTGFKTQDFDKNGDINIYDLTRVINNWTGTREKVSNDQKELDLNKDEHISILDVAEVITNWGEYEILE